MIRSFQSGSEVFNCGDQGFAASAWIIGIRGKVIRDQALRDPAGPAGSRMKGSGSSQVVGSCALLSGSLSSTDSYTSAVLTPVRGSDYIVVDNLILTQHARICP